MESKLILVFYRLLCYTSCMEIPPCSLSKSGKHDWKRSKRKHGRAGYFFVECVCGQTAQATMESGYRHVFTTAVKKGKSRHVSFRLKADDLSRLAACGKSAKGIVLEYIHRKQM